MSQEQNLAAVIKAPKAPLSVKEVEFCNLGHNELLIRNELVVLNQIEAKIAKQAAIPVEYPAILGSSFPGTIHAVGKNVKGYKVGERVVVSKQFGTRGNEYGAYQCFVLVKDQMVVKVKEKEEGMVLASQIMNASCVAGMFSGRLGLRRPGEQGEKGGRVLVYGGSSSFGGLSVAYLSKSGYEVVTTASPGKKEAISALGAKVVVDHTQEEEKVVKELQGHGPFDFVVDMMSTPSTISITTKVVKAQGGGKLYTTSPPSSEVPEGVECVFEPWSDSLYEAGNEELIKWTLEEYLPKGVGKGMPIKMLAGGLKAADEALERLDAGVGAKSLVVDPWE